jgi:hypothetical protein
MSDVQPPDRLTYPRACQYGHPRGRAGVSWMPCQCVSAREAVPRRQRSLDVSPATAGAILRRQPARLVEGRVEGGYTDAFKLICCDCGDHPYPDYREVSPRLEWLRWPRTMEAGVAAHERHLGLIT